MHVLSVSGSERSEPGVIVCLSFDVILRSCQCLVQLRQGIVRTAPYFETCLTSRDASLNSGRGTMAGGGLGTLGSSVESCLPSCLEIGYLIAGGASVAESQLKLEC